MLYMYVCYVHVLMYVFMYVYTYVWMYISMYVCMHKYGTVMNGFYRGKGYHDLTMEVDRKLLAAIPANYCRDCHWEHWPILSNIKFP